MNEADEPADQEEDENSGNGSGEEESLFSAGAQPWNKHCCVEDSAAPGDVLSRCKLRAGSAM